MEESVNKIYKQSNRTTMGEYATRKIDNIEVKIGTCENIFNCRYEQRGEIVYPYMCDNLFWRIPTPDEDGIRPGDFNLSL